MSDLDQWRLGSDVGKLLPHGGENVLPAHNVKDREFPARITLGSNKMIDIAVPRNVLRY